MRLKLEYFLTCNISDSIEAIYIQTWHDGRLMDAIYIYMLVLVLMTLNLMHGHSGSAKAKNQRCMLSLSATKEAINIKLATMVVHFYVTLTLQMFIWLDYVVFP